MASTTRNVVRYSALLGGIAFGLLHQSTLQAKYDHNKTQAHAANRAHLVEKARKAYAEKLVAEKAGGSKATLITDPEDPKFDVEKLIASWIESA